MKRIPLIVPLYKSYHLLENFVACLEQEHQLKFHCLFIDNGAVKNSKQIVEIFDRLRKKHTSQDNYYDYIINQDNWLYSKSVNKGFEYFKKQDYFDNGDNPYFMIFNPDCFPMDNNWLLKLEIIYHHIFGTDDKICTLGTPQLFKQGVDQVRIWHLGCKFKPQDQRCHPLDWWHIGAHIKADAKQLCRINNKDENVPEKELSYYSGIDGNTGAGLIVNVDKFERLNMLDAQAHPHYCSDSDFCLRAIRIGFTHYCANSSWFHHHPGTSVLG